MHAGVNHTVGRELQRRFVFPREQVGAGQMEDIARVIPIGENARNKREVHVVGALVIHDLRRPMGELALTVLNVCRASITPCRATIR